MRIHIGGDPFVGRNTSRSWRERGLWRCWWIDCPEAIVPPVVTAYRLRFSLDAELMLRAHVTADEQYELFLDGERIGRGPERGAPDHWFYESYELKLVEGSHVIVARVWSPGESAAVARMSVHPGFLFAPEGEWAEKLGTGHADWEAKRVEGYTFLDRFPSHLREAPVQIDGIRFDWGVERGEGDGWMPARKLRPGTGRLVDWEFYQQHLLYPAQLPPMLEQPVNGGIVRYVSAEIEGVVKNHTHLPDETTKWQRLFKGKGRVVVPANTTRRVIVDLENYYCAYPELTVSGGKGSRIEVKWAEALLKTPDPSHFEKGNRNEIEGKYFMGRGNVFLPDGGKERLFKPLWWEAGRYVQMVVQTDATALTLNRLRLMESRYPLEMESRFEADDARLTNLLPLLVRGVQMCAHETYYDCPYYEELMYTGDTRLETLLTYVMTPDDRLPRKALTMFDASRLPSGFTQSRYPSRIPQVIAPFSLWWVAMVHDFAHWRDDQAFVRSLLPGVRSTLEAFGRFIGTDGLLHAPDGWNFMDWVPAWDGGIPPDAIDGVSGLLNWHLVYTLALASELETNFGDLDLASRYSRLAYEIAGRASAMFWSEERGMFADDIDKRHFSEHTQCLAILSNQLDPERRSRVAEGLLTAHDLARTTIYFSHYLFEALRVLGRVDVLLERLSLWDELLKNGLKTPVEMPEPTRSDCHGWGSHPLFHFFATILGIRPGAGFRTVTITPQLGGLAYASGVMVHPNGELRVEVRHGKDAVTGSVRLPPGVSGMVRINGQSIGIESGSEVTF
jgi:alpha-L-rhamnosidase